MRYPPALTFTPAASCVYRAFTVSITLLLIALYAVSIATQGQLSTENTWLVALTVFVCIGLLYDAFKRPQGSLRYDQGQWHWLRGDQNIAGTCALHLDLQAYVLVSFIAQPATPQLFSKTTHWFHLEARREDPAAGRHAWLALRRALHAPVTLAENASTEFAAKDASHEKRYG